MCLRSITCSCMITRWCSVFYYGFKLSCLAINTYMYDYYMYTSISNVRSNLVGLSKSGVRSIVLSWKGLLKTICKMWTKIKFHQYLSTANRPRSTILSHVWSCSIKKSFSARYFERCRKITFVDLKIPNQNEHFYNG